jgi:hypothetical protein
LDRIVRNDGVSGQCEPDEHVDFRHVDVSVFD